MEWENEVFLMAQMTVGISVDHYLHVASQFVFLLSSVVLLGCASHLVVYNVYNPYVTRMSPYIIGVIPHIMYIYICIGGGFSPIYSTYFFPPQADPLATEVVVERSSRAQWGFSQLH